MVGSPPRVLVRSLAGIVRPERFQGPLPPRCARSPSPSLGTNGDGFDGSGRPRAGAAGAVEAGVGGGEGDLPFGGEGGVSGAALGVGGAVDAEAARGQAGVAGLRERLQEAGVLQRLAAGEGAGRGVVRHAEFSAEQILFYNPVLPPSLRPRTCPGEAIQRREWIASSLRSSQ